MADADIKAFNDGSKKIAKTAFKQRIQQALKASGLQLQAHELDACDRFADVFFDEIWRVGTGGTLKTSDLAKAAATAASVFAKLNDTETTRCVAALLDVGVDTAKVQAIVAALVAQEVASAGLATPAVAIQSVLLVDASITLSKSAIKANMQCGPLAVRGVQGMKAQWGDIVQAAEEALGSFVRSVENMLRAQSMGGSG